MTLPAPGSVHLHKATNRLMRLIISEDTIILHNCEIAMHPPAVAMVSWSGAPEVFRRAFKPAPTAAYPRTSKGSDA